MSVTVTLTETNLQPFTKSPVAPRGFDVFRLSDDQAGDASGGTFNYNLQLNSGRSAYPGYWTVIQLLFACSGSMTADVGFYLDDTERFEKWERWTSSTYGLFTLNANGGPSGSTTEARDQARGLFPLFLGQPLLAPVVTTASQGGLWIQTNNVNGANFGMSMVLARSYRNIAWPVDLRL